MAMNNKPIKGIVVDGYCLGNPGIGGYRGLDLATGKEVFTVQIGYCTNNIAEFFALVHAAKWMSDNGRSQERLYSDSKAMMYPFRRRNIPNTSMDISRNPVVGKMLNRAKDTLKAIDIPQLEYWDKHQWGENPADFGNKR
jgi:ribonuclease HI